VPVLPVDSTFIPTPQRIDGVAQQAPPTPVGPNAPTQHSTVDTGHNRPGTVPNPVSGPAPMMGPRTR
jgi:hypothetical protein